MSKDGNCIADIRRERHAMVVQLAGEVDMHHAPAVHKGLLALCDEKPPRLVLNLEKVSYMDSSGIGTLVATLRRIHGYGGRLALCCMQEQVRNVFEITRLDKVFLICATEKEAISG